MEGPPSPQTVAWTPTCACGGHRIRTTTSRRLQRHPWYRQHWQQRIEARWPASVPCTVLDPFTGSSTTLLVARTLGRKSVGVELSESYCQLSIKRLQQQVLPFADVAEPLSRNGHDATQAEMEFDA
jgi:hypothetical protein